MKKRVGVPRSDEHGGAQFSRREGGKSQRKKGEEAWRVKKKKAGFSPCLLTCLLPSAFGWKLRACQVSPAPEKRLEAGKGDMCHEKMHFDRTVPSEFRAQIHEEGREDDDCRGNQTVASIGRRIARYEFERGKAHRLQGRGSQGVDVTIVISGRVQLKTDYREKTFFKHWLKNQLRSRGIRNVIHLATGKA